LATSYYVLWVTALTFYVVTATREVSAQLPDLLLRPSLTIDGTRDLLAHVQSLAIGPAGQIAVAEFQDRRIRIFDRSGKPIQSLGREGSGPGEFRSISNVGWFSDTVWAYDARARRLTYFKAGKQIGTRDIDSGARVLEGSQAGPGHDFTFRSTLPQMWTPNRSFIAMLSVPSESAPTDFEGERIILGLVTTGSVVQRILVNVSAPPGISARSNQALMYARQPFLKSAVYAIAPDASRIAVLTNQPTGAEREHTFEIVMISTQGDTLYRQRYPYKPQRITKAISDSTLGAELETIGKRGPGSSELASAFRRQVVIPVVFPPVEGLVAGSDGSLWIRLRDTPQGRPYLVVDERGREVGTGLLPTNAVVMAANAQKAWAVHLDQYDVPSIVRYEVSQKRRTR
jgi:hypothetical protein